MEERQRIIIASDHAAFSLKERIKDHLVAREMTVTDLGAASGGSVDYPDYAIRLANSISRGEHERGILLCGTGIGMSMVANRFPRVRAALCSDIFAACMSRRHNNANVLVMGGRVIGEDLALAIVDAWLDTDFDGGRHQRRIDLFDGLDLKNQEPPR